MDQNRLFYETFEEVLNEIVVALGGHKRVAGDLWPGLSPATAYARLKGCLNADKAEKFSPGEVMWLLRRGREKGAHIGIEWLCEELGYTLPTPVEPQDQQAEVARQLDASLERLEALVGRAERLRDVRPVRAVR